MEIKIGDNTYEPESVVNALKEGGYVVRTSEEDTTHFDAKFKTRLSGLSHNDELLKPVLGKAVKEERESFESLIGELTGVQRNAESYEPWNDYGKRAFTAKIQDLEQKVKNGVKNDDLVKQINDLKLVHKAELTKLQEKNSELSTKVSQAERMVGVNAALGEMRAKYRNEDTDDFKALVSSVEAVALSELKSLNIEKRTIGDQENYFVIDDNGSVKLGPDGNPMTQSGYLKSKLDILIDKGRTVEGSGTKKPSANGDNPNSPTTTNFNGEGVTTKLELTTKLVKAGFKQGTKEYTELYRKYAKPEMPLQ